MPYKPSPSMGEGWVGVKCTRQKITPAKNAVR